MIAIGRRRVSIHWMKNISKLIIVLMAAGFITPVVMTVGMSVYEDGAITWQGYKDLFFDCFVFYRLFWNSVLYSCAITVFQLIVNILGAFGLRFAKFRGRGLLFLLYLVLMMMPLQVMILPNYLGLRDMNLIDTGFAIILPMIFSPLGLVVLYQYTNGIDPEIIEAARLETNSMGRIIVSALLPQIRICIFAVGLFIFAEAWGLVEQPMLFLRREELKTLTIFLSETEKYSSNVLLPASVIYIIPVLLLYMFFHEELEEGLKFI